MAKYYTNHPLGLTLKKAIDTQLASDPRAQVSILEELALVRHSVVPLVRLYDAVITEGERDPENIAKHLETQTLVGAQMREALKQVCEVAERAGKIEASAQENISAVSLGLIVDQIVAICVNVLHAECQEELYEIERQVRLHVKVEEEKVRRGTHILPSDDAREMNETVPKFLQLEGPAKT